MLAAVQVHHGDFASGLGPLSPERAELLARRNAVVPLRDSGLFERVVLAAADVPENDALEPWAERLGVELYRGAVDDVGARLAAAARAAGCDAVARVLVWWFFVDVELVRAQLELLVESGAEYVNLPPDFDHRFGADVSTVGFLERASRRAPAAFRRSPWAFAEAFPARFRVATYEDVPTFGRGRFERVRAGLRELWPAEQRGAAEAPFPYRVALEELPRGGRALDLCCGLGAGAALLAEQGSVLGVDADPRLVEHARELHGDRVELAACDPLALELADASLDLAVCVDALERVEDDCGLLERLARWLRRDGTLVLEAPLFARRPFLGIAEPLWPGRVREYDVSGLIGLVAERFRVREAYGVNRGAYLDLESARSAVLLVAEPR